MCDLALVSRARAAADDILHGRLRLPLRKSLRIDTPEAFDRFVAVLAAKLRACAQEPVQEALEAALDVLDVDWGTISQQRHAALLQQAVHSTRTALNPVANDIGAALTAAGPQVANAARAAARESGLAVGAKLSALDERMVAHVARSHTLFVRDAIGRRADEFGRKAREVVAKGLGKGFGRDAIAQNLEAAARQEILGQSGTYWEVVAAAFIGQGRSYAQVSSYAEAGIKAYRVEGVLDERTSSICRLMHGKVFTVTNALENFKATERLRNPADIRELNPWAHEDGEGLYLMLGNRRLAIMSAESTSVTPPCLCLPPFHPLCRSTTTNA